MANPNPKCRFPKLGTPEGDAWQDKCIETRMRNTVLRQWLREEVSNWSEDEVQAYIADKSNPALRRNFLDIVFNSKKEKTQLQLMEQLDGKPKQEIETTLNTATPISLEVYGDPAPRED